MGRLSHILFLLVLSQYENILTHSKERGMGQLAHFISLVALRVTAGGRNP